MRQAPTHSRSATRIATLLLLVVTLGLVGSCSDGTAKVDLQLHRVDPSSSDGPIPLNHDIRLFFNDILEPSWVTSASVRVEEKGTNRPLNVRVLIEGKEIRIQPRGPLRPDLSGGSFRPGAEYVVTLAGFPDLSGPKSIRGAQLPYTIEHTFRTAEEPAPGARDGGSPLFLDASPGRASPLKLRPEFEGASEGRPLPWDGPLLLACAEPLDPRGIRPEAFEIRELRRYPLRRGISPELNREPAKAVGIKSIILQSNEDEDVVDATVRPGALLEIEFEDNLPLSDGSHGTFELVLKDGVKDGGGLVDFHGNQVFARPIRDQDRIRFYAGRRDDFVPEREGSYDFEFLDAHDFAPLLDPSSDGTAHWSDTGRLEVRYPRAAGDGSAGRVEFGATFDGVDLHASSWGVPAGTETRLEGSGLVVLRSQGRVEIDGALMRELEPGAPLEPMWDPNAVETSAQTTTLTNWLAEAREKNAAWTVIVAGGDLVVRGRIDVETPLLLVAGGRIFGADGPHAARDQVWLLGEGGFEVMPVDRDQSMTPMVTPPLVMDPPLFNQLVEPLTFVAISSEVPKGVAPTDWGPSQVLGSVGSHGSYRVQFLKPDDPSQGHRGGTDGRPSTREERLGQALPHEEPKDVLLEGGQVDGVGGRVRLRIELQLTPAKTARSPGPWVPPFVDRVRLTWTPNPR